MRSRTVITVLALAAAGAAAPPASAQDSYRHGRILEVEPGVTVQRATETAAEEAFRNLPFLPGDRVWTDASGRIEFQFPGGTVVRVDRRSKLDYAGHEEEGEERIVLRLWSGSVLVHAHTGDNSRFEVETPAGMVQVLDRSVVRADLQSGETRLSVYAGQAALDDGRRRVRLSAGERTYAPWGAQAEEPRSFDPGEEDEFVAWDSEREAEEAQGAATAEVLPEELGPYAGELQQNGTWQSAGVEGNVWVPNVAAGWQPYSNGQWAWTPYGWTWIPHESWGWAPFHYGRWGFSASLGWYWAPGHTWGPAWVSWAVGAGYVGWCPLGRNDHAVTPWGRSYGYGGYAVTRGSFGGRDAWHVVARGDLGSRDVGRHRVSLAGIDPASFRVADDAVMRPTRDATSLRAGDAAPRAVSRRQTMGDFVRELQVDNKTTIPAPWTRGYGPPPAGVEGARYGAPHPTDRGGEEEKKESRTGTANAGAAGAPPPASRTTPPPATSASGGHSNESRPASSGGAERRESRPTWIGGGVNGERPRGSDGNGADRSQGSRHESSNSYRPRGGESSFASRPRSESAAPRPAQGGGGGHASSRGDRR